MLPFPTTFTLLEYFYRISCDKTKINKRENKVEYY